MEAFQELPATCEFQLSFQGDWLVTCQGVVRAVAMVTYRCARMSSSVLPGDGCAVVTVTTAWASSWAPPVVVTMVTRLPGSLSESVASSSWATMDLAGSPSPSGDSCQATRQNTVSTHQCSEHCKQMWMTEICDISIPSMSSMSSWSNWKISLILASWGIKPLSLRVTTTLKIRTLLKESYSFMWF